MSDAQSLLGNWLNFYHAKGQGFNSHFTEVMNKMQGDAPYTTDNWTSDSVQTMNLVREFWEDALNMHNGTTAAPTQSADLLFAFQYDQPLVLEKDFVTQVGEGHLAADLWNAGFASHRDHLMFPPRTASQVARLQVKNHTETDTFQPGLYQGLVYDKSTVPPSPVSRLQVVVFPPPAAGTNPSPQPGVVHSG